MADTGRRPDSEVVREGEDMLPARAHQQTWYGHAGPNARTAIRSLLGLLLLVNLSMSVYQLPLNRVIERRLCREYYAEHGPAVINPGKDVDEQLCKVDVVQKELAWIQGAMETAWIIGDFVMTIPLGFVAERYGRRTVLWLNLVPRICMLAWAVVVGSFEQLLPTKAIIVAPFLSVLGGDCVFNSLTLALASDLTEDRVLRATYFGYMSSTSYVVALLGPALASAGMSLSLWLPFWFGIILLVIAVQAVRNLPAEQSGSLATDDMEGHRQPLLSSPVLKAQDKQQSLAYSIMQRFDTIKTIVASHPRNFSLLMTSFFLASLASSDTKLLVQYISKRYQWTFASAGYLLSGKAVVNFTLLTLVIPRILKRRAESLHLASRPHSQDITNITYAKICLIVSILGALAIAFASTIWLLVPSLLLYALGSALPIFTLSLLKSPLVSPPHPADLSSSQGSPETHIFSIVMLVKTLGSLVGAPLMATVWIRGIVVGGFALGMPYFVSALCYGLATVVFSGIEVDG